MCKCNFKKILAPLCFLNNLAVVYRVSLATTQHSDHCYYILFCMINYQLFTRQVSTSI